jgi:hypothetical protein
MANLKLNRQQLAQFLTNHEAIKAFEALFANVQDSIPSSLDDVQTTADNAQLQAAEALGQLSAIANAVSLALYGSYSEILTPDNYIQTGEQVKEDIYIPPISLGSMAEQNANKVAITGGSVKVDSLTNGSVSALVASSVTLNNGAAALAATLLNSPTAGNPTKWIPINDNGTTRYIPSW